jgi:putative hydrolase of the HAD superfamily
MAMFDHVTESSLAGIRKPEPEFYRRALAAIDIEAGNALFLDDLGINLKPARAMGMTTIKVLDETQALTDLEAILGLDLRS